MVAEDASSIIVYARDFRKICPPQEEGKEGGYSPDELEEIAALVEGQCVEIAEVLEGWMSVIKELEEKISTTATEHGSFTNKFDEVANELALSQGLGQKYGAPRRRAQVLVTLYVYKYVFDDSRILLYVRSVCAQKWREMNKVPEKWTSFSLYWNFLAQRLCETLSNLRPASRSRSCPH